LVEVQLAKLEEYISALELCEDAAMSGLPGKMYNPSHIPNQRTPL
jgi:hypothetical protein